MTAQTQENSVPSPVGRSIDISDGDVDERGGQEGGGGKGVGGLVLGALRFSNDSVHLRSECPLLHLAVHRGSQRPGLILLMWRVGSTLRRLICTAISSDRQLYKGTGMSSTILTCWTAKATYAKLSYIGGRMGKSTNSAPDDHRQVG